MVNEAVATCLFLHHKQYINDCVRFEQNFVVSGGGIYSNRSVVVFENKKNFIFYNNSAYITIAGNSK